jgi:hypothetical protein
MHAYVKRWARDPLDPDKALHQAKEYLEKKGNEIPYFKGIVKRALGEYGLKPKCLDGDALFPIEEDATTIQAAVSAAVPLPLPQPVQVASKTETTALQVQAQPTEATESKLMEHVEERVEAFLKKNHKMTNDETVRRFNDLERLVRDLHVAGLPDYLKKKVEDERSGRSNSGYNNNQSNKNNEYKAGNSSARNNNDRRGNNNRRPGNFERNKRGYDKKYKKKFVEKDNGDFMAQFVTDDEDEADNSQE